MSGAVNGRIGYTPAPECARSWRRARDVVSVSVASSRSCRLVLRRAPMKAGPRLALLSLAPALPLPPRRPPLGVPRPPAASSSGRPRRSASRGPGRGRRLPSLPHVRRPRGLGGGPGARSGAPSSPRPSGSSRRSGRSCPPPGSWTTCATATAGGTRSSSSPGAASSPTLVLGELLEGQGRFTDAIADGLWLICEESYWGVPAHVGAQKRGVGPPRRHRAHRRPLRRRDGRAPRLDRLPDGRSPRRRRTRSCASACASRWTGGSSPRTSSATTSGGWASPRARSNNWNPWINSNWLASVLLLERDPERRVRAVREDRAEPRPLHRRLPGRRRLRRGAELLGPRRGVALRVAGAPARRDRRAPRRLPRAGRARDRPVHRPRLHRRRLLRGHRRRVGEGEARAGARLPLRPGGGGPVPRRLRLLPRRPPRAVRPGRRPALREPRARPAGPPRGERPRGHAARASRSPARSGSPTCR